MIVTVMVTLMQKESSQSELLEAINASQLYAVVQSIGDSTQFEVWKVRANIMAME